MVPRYEKTPNEYIDITNRITHLEFKKDKQKFVLPIKPCIIKNKISEYKNNINIPEVKKEFIEEILLNIDKKIDDTLFLKYYVPQHMSTRTIRLRGDPAALDSDKSYKTLPFSIVKNFILYNNNTPHV